LLDRPAVNTEVECGVFTDASRNLAVFTRGLGTDVANFDTRIRKKDNDILEVHIALISDSEISPPLPAGGRDSKSPKGDQNGASNGG